MLVAEFVLVLWDRYKPGATMKKFVVLFLAVVPVPDLMAAGIPACTDDQMLGYTPSATEVSAHREFTLPLSLTHSARKFICLTAAWNCFCVLT